MKYKNDVFYGFEQEQENEIDWDSFIPIDSFKEKPNKKEKKIKQNQINCVELEENETENKKETECLESSQAQENWKEFNLNPKILSTLDELGFISPTDIQAKTLIHTINRYRDVIGAAETVFKN